MRRTWLVALLVCGSCANPRSVTCDDGTICSAGRVCAADRCLTPDQATACNALAEGELCRADDRAGRCTDGACLPSCGDGVLDGGEQCDDTNYVSHDGCSSACLLETRTWERWPDPWRSRNSHAATYDRTRDRLVLFGGNDGGLLDDTWERTELASGSRWTRIPVAGPSARTTTMAYDPLRRVTVLFGGRASGFLDDTWEYDGATWQQRTLATAPEARGNHAMVFDETRGKIVLVGGFDGTTFFDDTWTYDGAWTKLAVTGPTTRVRPAIAFDPDRQKVVLFLPDVAETWELGATWTQGPMGPGPRPGAAMAHVRPAGVVLFGGEEHSDTWLYDGTWARLSLSNQPSGISFHSLTAVPDATGGDGATKAVLVGGRDRVSNSEQLWELRSGAPAWVQQASPTSPRVTGNPVTLDGRGRLAVWALDGALWTFDHTGWTSLASTGAGPIERSEFAFAYDAQRERFVLSGGSDPMSPFNGDTWELDDTTAVNVTTVGGPSGRQGAVAAYDANRDVVVMVGGVDALNTSLDETWELDRGVWQQRSTPTSPGPQNYAAIAFDPIRARIVMLANDGTTWAYDGAWEQLPVPRLAVVRRQAAMAFDPARRRLVVFGGRDPDRTLFGDALELGDGGWVAIEAEGQAPSPRLTAGLAYVPSVHALVVYGGREALLGFDDTWLLAYRSATPDEVCDDDVDNDGDRRSDGDDPDCVIASANSSR